MVFDIVVALEPPAVATNLERQCAFLSTLFHAGGFSPFDETKHASLANDADEFTSVILSHRNEFHNTGDK